MVVTELDAARLHALRLLETHQPESDGAHVLLIRHAERHPIRSQADGLSAALTDEGRAAARGLGGRLSDRLADTLYASPVQRCVDTATLVADAAATRGQAADARVRAVDLLAAAYIEDEETWREEYFADDPRTVTRRYCSGDTIPGFAPLNEATDTLSRWLQAVCRPGAITLCVTHDIVLVPFLAAAAGITFGPDAWLPYLGGALVTRVNEGIVVRATRSGTRG